MKRFSEASEKVTPNGTNHLSFASSILHFKRKYFLACHDLKNKRLVL